MCSGIARITSLSSAVSSSGRPAAGSSSSTSRGLPTTARATSTRRRWAAPSVPTSAYGSMSSRRTRSRRARRRGAGAAAHLRVLVDHRDVVVHRQLLDRLLGLERAAHSPPRAAVVRHREQVLAERRDLPLDRLDETAEHVEERRLAGAVGPDQPARPLLEGHAHAVERNDAAEADGQIGDLDQDSRSRGAAGRLNRPPIQPGEPGDVLGHLLDDPARRRGQHLQHPDPEQDRQPVGGDAPVVEQLPAGT